MTGNSACDVLSAENAAGQTARRRERPLSWCRNSLVEPLLSVLFPPRCVGCGAFEQYLCERCRGSIYALPATVCPHCGEPGAYQVELARCPACIGKEQGYQSARSAFVHEGVARQLVSTFKSAGQPIVGEVMAELAKPAFERYVRSLGAPGEVLVTWVPSHKATKRERGYNQAEVLARALAVGLPGLTCGQVVLKIKKTRHQKGLGRADRLRNLRGAFLFDTQKAKSVGLGAGPQGMTRFTTLLLVDDVYTTGATASAVAQILTGATGLPVHVFTFSRAIAASRERHD